MSIDYKLHKATEKKIDSLVDQKLDIKRREDNLIKQIEQFQKDNKQLIADQKAWELQKNLELEQLQKERGKARDTQEQSEKALKSDRKRIKAILDDEKVLQKALNDVKRDSKLAKSILKRYKKKDDILYAKEQVLKDQEKAILNSKRLADKRLKNINPLLNKAKNRVKEATELFNRADRKNSEANGLKIKLGIERKNIEIIRKDLKEQRSWVGQRTAELQVSVREIRLKRKLLSKAYSMADLDELDTKVIQKIGW